MGAPFKQLLNGKLASDTDQFLATVNPQAIREHGSERGSERHLGATLEKILCRELQVFRKRPG